MVLSFVQIGVSSVDSAGTIEIVSISSDGLQGNGHSENPSISSDGRFVAFDSVASNLVPGDTNSAPDIFVNDRKTGITNRVSVASDGSQGNNYSRESYISADGRFVVFSSAASNLVSEDLNGKPDIFVYDMQAEETNLVSVASDRTQGNLSSYSPVISPNGRYVSFTSYSDNLVDLDTNNTWDVFVYDRQTRIIDLVSFDPDGFQFPVLLLGVDPQPSYLSADGRYVLFSLRMFPPCHFPSVCEDPFSELYLRDRSAAKTEKLIFVCEAGWDCYYPGDGNISSDGHYVAFTSGFGGLAKKNIFTYDTQNGLIELVSAAIDGSPGYSSGYSMFSSNDRYVVFDSNDSNLVIGDTNARTDIFIRDRIMRRTELVSLASDGSQGNNSSSDPFVSANGRFVAFSSYASNLVIGDKNSRKDIFVRDRGIASLWLKYYLPIMVR